MSAARPPEVVVVIPWGGEHLEQLINQIDSLVAQDIPEAIEVRVSLNARAAPEVHSRITGGSTAHRRIVTVDASAKPGPSFARNRGADPVSPLLLFCDADDEVESEWARHMVETLRDGADLVGGVLDYGPLNTVPFALSRAAELPVAFGHLPFSPSASLGIRGHLFQQLRGFDEHLKSGEDIDLCWRAQYLGARIVFVPAAQTAYRLRQGWRVLFDQGRRYGLSDVELYRRHRSRGMARTPADMVGELARVVALTGFAVLGSEHRLKLATRLGTLIGHLQGSVRARTIFL